MKSSVVAEELELDLGIKIVINECRTCKDAYRAGGIEHSRRKGGYVDAEGNVTQPYIYPPTVYDLDLEYQGRYGMNSVDKPIAWGVEARGKGLLQNPTQIRID